MPVSSAWSAITVDVPADIRFTIRPRIQVAAPGKYGSPVSKLLHREVSANRSMPLVAQSQAIVSCSTPSRAGSALTENTDVAVSPTGPSPLSAVMTATPAACRRNAAVLPAEHQGASYRIGGTPPRHPRVRVGIPTPIHHERPCATARPLQQSTMPRSPRRPTPDQLTQPRCRPGTPRRPTARHSAISPNRRGPRLGDFAE